MTTVLHSLFSLVLSSCSDSSGRLLRPSRPFNPQTFRIHWNYVVWTFPIFSDDCIAEDSLRSEQWHCKICVFFRCHNCRVEQRSAIKFCFTSATDVISVMQIAYGKYCLNCNKVVESYVRFKSVWVVRTLWSWLAGRRSQRGPYLHNLDWRECQVCCTVHQLPSERPNVSRKPRHQ